MDNATFSIWEQESFLAPRDVVIIGGGLVGLWSAWYLKQQDPTRKVPTRPDADGPECGAGAGRRRGTATLRRW